MFWQVLWKYHAICKVNFSGIFSSCGMHTKIEKKDQLAGWGECIYYQYRINFKEKIQNQGQDVVLTGLEHGLTKF